MSYYHVAGMIKGKGCWVGVEPIDDRQLVRGEDFDASRDTWLAADQPGTFGEHNLAGRGWRQMTVPAVRRTVPVRTFSFTRLPTDCSHTRVLTLPFAPKRPVMCFDESPTPLIGEG